MITIIGMGTLGKSLARALITSGMTVNFGVSSLEKYQDEISTFGQHATLHLVRDAIKLSDIVVLAVPYHAAIELASMISDWENKIIIDVSTPLLADFSGLEVGFDISGAEIIASHANNARVIKAFNTVGAETIENNSSIKSEVFLPVCGDDMEAKDTVIDLANRIDFNAINAGPLNIARYLEPFAMMWIQLAFTQGLGKTFEFGLLKKNLNHQK